MSSYQQKLADRASGKVESQTYPSGPMPGSVAFESLSPAERYAAKLAARLAPKAAPPPPPPAPAEPAPEPEPEAEAEPEPAPEPMPAPKKFGKGYRR
jgi:hypothetical protein